MSRCAIRPCRPAAAAMFLCLLWLIGCTAHPFPVQPPAPTSEPTAAAPTDQKILALPAAFRYEVTVRPAGVPDEPATVVTGHYRAGAWSQSARRGEDVAEELIVASDGSGGPAQSYTRAAGETTWTRWPGEGFDAGYGLASPFSVLRLYPLADQRAQGEATSLEGVTDTIVKEQAVFSADTIRRLLRAGAFSAAADPEERSALESQLAALFLPQTVTYWAGGAGRVYQAAATLLTEDTEGQPAPWLEVVWRFWGFDDPTIAVAAPAAFVDAGDSAPADQPTAAASPEPPLDPRTNLRVRVFAVPGVPAEKATVTVYPAGKQKTLGSTTAVDAQFVLPAGTYDVKVAAGGGEQWLKDVAMVEGSVVSQDVVFDFGTLALTVVQNGATPQVDMVIYPAGQRQSFADYRSENPTAVQLAAGKYDVEVALPDYTGNKVVAGIEVRAGETVSQTINLDE